MGKNNKGKRKAEQVRYDAQNASRGPAAAAALPDFSLPPPALSPEPLPIRIAEQINIGSTSHAQFPNGASPNPPQQNGDWGAQPGWGPQGRDLDEDATAGSDIEFANPNNDADDGGWGSGTKTRTSPTMHGPSSPGQPGNALPGGWPVPAQGLTAALHGLLSSHPDAAPSGGEPQLKRKGTLKRSAAAARNAHFAADPYAPPAPQPPPSGAAKPTKHVAFGSLAGLLRPPADPSHNVASPPPPAHAGHLQPGLSNRQMSGKHQSRGDWSNPDALPPGLRSFPEAHLAQSPWGPPTTQLPHNGAPPMNPMVAMAQTAGAPGRPQATWMQWGNEAAKKYGMAGMPKVATAMAATVPTAPPSNPPPGPAHPAHGAPPPSLAALLGASRMNLDVLRERAAALQAQALAGQGHPVSMPAHAQGHPGPMPTHAQGHSGPMPAHTQGHPMSMPAHARPPATGPATPQAMWKALKETGQLPPSFHARQMQEAHQAPKMQQADSWGREWHAQGGPPKGAGGDPGGWNNTGKDPWDIVGGGGDDGKWNQQANGDDDDGGWGDAAKGGDPWNTQSKGGDWSGAGNQWEGGGTGRERWDSHGSKKSHKSHGKGDSRKKGEDRSGWDQGGSSWGPNNNGDAGGGWSSKTTAGWGDEGGGGWNNKDPGGWNNKDPGGWNNKDPGGWNDQAGGSGAENGGWDNSGGHQKGGKSKHRDSLDGGWDDRGRSAHKRGPSSNGHGKWKDWDAIPEEEDEEYNEDEEYYNSEDEDEEYDEDDDDDMYTEPRQNGQAGHRDPHKSPRISYILSPNTVKHGLPPSGIPAFMNMGHGGKGHTPSHSSRMLPDPNASQTMNFAMGRMNNLFTLAPRPPGKLVPILDAKGAAIQAAERALFGRSRLARDRIHWAFDPNKDPRVGSLIRWVEDRSLDLAVHGLRKFLETGQRGALIACAQMPTAVAPGDTQPAFDYITFEQATESLDRILQESIACYNPAQKVVVFVFLLSKSGNSMAMWRRKCIIPDAVMKANKGVIERVVLRLKTEESILVDEFYPPRKGTGTRGIPGEPKKKRGFWRKLFGIFKRKKKPQPQQ